MDSELNKRLAKWAGFRFRPVTSPYPWYSPNDKLISTLPNFTQSLDACFKWLVPKFQDKGYNVELYSYEHKGHRATVYLGCFSQRGSDGFDPYLEPISQVENDNPALALCKAISRLIEKDIDKTTH